MLFLRPYVNRVLVRRPQNKSRFSGNVVVEILNPSARVDIDRIWVETWRFMVRNGDIYIGITAKGDVLDALYRIDPSAMSAFHGRIPARQTAPHARYFPGAGGI